MVTLSVDDQQEVTDQMKKILEKIDPDGTHLTASDMDEAFRLMNDSVQVVFLDIEMPGMSGLEGAGLLQKQFEKLNIIFVTEHTEYALEAHSLHPSGFLAKPFDEQDIRRELLYLRFPIDIPKSPLRVQCCPFAVFAGDRPFDFKSDRTIELFAYLVYKNGAFCTNGEIIGVLWDGNADKNGRLRQLVMDMRECLAEVGAENIILKKYGKIGINTNLLKFIGDRNLISDEFNWF